jgi:hypothetical protein
MKPGSRGKIECPGAATALEVTFARQRASVANHLEADHYAFGRIHLCAAQSQEGPHWVTGKIRRTARLPHAAMQGKLHLIGDTDAVDDPLPGDGS